VSVAVEVRDLFRVHSTTEGDAASLQGLSLTVREEELLVVLGPSGSGKTSLLRILAGLDSPSVGSVRVFGREIAKLPERELDGYRASTLGYADQHYHRVLAPELRAREIVGLQLRLRGSERDRWQHRADELLDQVGLLDRRSAYPAELSGGEQQRVALCAALAHRPRLLLADEPTGELDARNAAIVYRVIGDLVRANRCTALLVSHDPSSASIADRIVRIRDGRVSDEVVRESASGETIVVDANGWMRLPEELRARAAIGSRARAKFVRGGIFISAAGERVAPEELGQRVVRRRRAASEAVVAEVRGVRKSYGRELALDGVDATISAGRLYALTGPSGSGKTTLLRLIAGFDDADDGEILLAGIRLRGLDAAARARLRREHVGYVTQQPSLIEYLSVRENVALGLEVRGRDVRGVDEVIAAVGLGQRAEQRVSRLSTGEQARVAVARAIAASPTLLLVDEPTSRLDQANAASVTALLERLADEWQAAIVCATHDPIVIERAEVEIALA